jgi:hypothetical protein
VVRHISNEEAEDVSGMVNIKIVMVTEFKIEVESR